MINGNTVLSVPIAEISDVAKLSKIEDTTIEKNTLITETEFSAEIKKCTKLCFVPKAYLQSYVTKISLVERLPYALKVVKG
jgi:uncharacterized protein YifN (PemK superfamily)